ncbi:MAG: thiamine pyrophosphate-dependent enzyme [Peptococcaceae bacterium]|nr:thiamine pyrophosphate-dependent enzyme [Peptococcaceae bacterium]
MINSIKELPAEELVYGSMACAGCGGNLALRLALKVLGKNTVVVTTASCLMGVTTFYPQLAFGVTCVTSVFPGTGAVVSGVVAGLKRKGREDVNVLGFVGDGGTVDIGLQALSGAMERGEKFIWLCYDNEAYMNTGTQRSGATPYGAITSTTPGGPNEMWENRPKKDMLAIAVDHGIPYVASASIAYPDDYIKKIQKAMQAPGPAYIQVLAPCPPGWGHATSQTVAMGRLAVQTGIWPLAEHEQGEFRFTHRPVNRKPVGEYLNQQGRFAHLSPETVSAIQADVDAKWDKFNSGCGF